MSRLRIDQQDPQDMLVHEDRLTFADALSLAVAGQDDDWHYQGNVGCRSYRFPSEYVHPASTPEAARYRRAAHRRRRLKAAERLRGHG